jgi:hypothetical protein
MRRVILIAALAASLTGCDTHRGSSGSEAASVGRARKLPDGSWIKVEAVSYGGIHRIPSFRDPEFFKSASPTIMFTTRRNAPLGHYLEPLWTKAEALDTSGRWFSLRRRSEARPVNEGLEDAPLIYEGPSPEQTWETWEFPNCPPPSPSLNVRVWLSEKLDRYVVFRLPNDEAWRVRSKKEQTNGFDPQKWLNSELSRAAYTGNVDYVRDVVAQGANPNSFETDGSSALMIASQDGHTKVVRYLLAHGADVNAHSKTKPIDRTALMAAASNGGHPEIVHLLIEQGANVNVRGELGWTALIWAAREGDIETVKYLLSQGADPNVKALDGKSTVELTKETVSANRHEIITILKDAQAER